MVLNIAPSTLREPSAATNKDLDASLYQKYVRYRAKLQDRVDYPAHLGGAAAAGDDDDPASNEADFDFVNDWSITDPASMPWSKLRISNLSDNILRVGHTPKYMMPALLIANSVCLGSEPPPADMTTYWESCDAQLQRVVGLSIDDYLGLCEEAVRTDRNYKALMPSDYSDAEMEYIAELWHASKDLNMHAAAQPGQAAAQAPPPPRGRGRTVVGDGDGGTTA
eukprot:CAMPEP_0172179766 /NCGR_PEP_ID=MMETSP1050-20130122/16814_1 /TAXON_ID=233186 /ORGANISM="Cryptomonas curvata, Strain CCAP979/52" /LENGTH=222 /DNA_ID=CAMNT_0012852713 /DNA_START=197 /DNA_END=862 /DNA_ORIENTATION=-